MAEPERTKDETMQAEAPDSVEVWGRRIGRLLGWAFAGFLLFLLFRTYAP